MTCPSHYDYVTSRSNLYDNVVVVYTTVHNLISWSSTTTNDRCLYLHRILQSLGVSSMPYFFLCSIHGYGKENKYCVVVLEEMKQCAPYTFMYYLCVRNNGLNLNVHDLT